MSAIITNYYRYYDYPKKEFLKSRGTRIIKVTIYDYYDIQVSLVNEIDVVVVKAADTAVSGHDIGGVGFYSHERIDKQ